MPTVVSHTVGPGGDYPDLKAWASGQQRNLTIFDQIAQARILPGDNFNASGANLSFFTTDATRYIHIVADSTEYGEAPNCYGSYDETGFPGARHSASQGAVYTSGTSCANIKIEGVALMSYGTSGEVIDFVNSSAGKAMTVDIDRCLLIRDLTNNSSGNPMVQFSARGQNTLNITNTAFVQLSSNTSSQSTQELLRILNLYSGPYNVELNIDSCTFAFLDGNSNSQCIQNKITGSGNGVNTTNITNTVLYNADNTLVQLDTQVLGTNTTNASVYAGEFDVDITAADFQVVPGDLDDKGGTVDLRPVSSGNLAGAGTYSASVPADIAGTTRDSGNEAIGAWFVAGIPPTDLGAYFKATTDTDAARGAPRSI